MTNNTFEVAPIFPYQSTGFFFNSLFKEWIVGERQKLCKSN